MDGRDLAEGEAGEGALEENDAQEGHNGRYHVAVRGVIGVVKRGPAGHALGVRRVPEVHGTGDSDIQRVLAGARTRARECGCRGG